MTLNALLRRDDTPDEPALTVVPETPQEADDETAALPLPPGHALTTASGDRVNAADQVIAVIRHAFRHGRRHAKDVSGREGGWVNAALNGRPPSVNDQRDYLGNRRWLPPGHEEGIADRIGEAYYAGIAVPVAAALNAAGFVFKRLFRFLFVFAVLLLAVFVVALLTAGLPPAVIAVVSLFSVVSGYLGLIALLLAARRAIGRRRPGRSSQSRAH